MKTKFTYILKFTDSGGSVQTIEKENYDQIINIANAHFSLGAGLMTLVDSEGEVYALDVDRIGGNRHG